MMNHRRTSARPSGREHALQCGVLHAGMLISARDLVLRLPVSDERSVRVGLSGNLCRCTGYVGIVRAVRSVIAERRKRALQLFPVRTQRTRSSGIRNGQTQPECSHSADCNCELYHEDSARWSFGFHAREVFKDHFTVGCPPTRSSTCSATLRGFRLPSGCVAHRVPPGTRSGLIRVKLGPVSAISTGPRISSATPKILSGRNRWHRHRPAQPVFHAGRIPLPTHTDRTSAATRVELSIGYSLRECWRQIAREGCTCLASRLTADFARNLERQLSGDRSDGFQWSWAPKSGWLFLPISLCARVARALRRVLVSITLSRNRGVAGAILAEF